MPLALALIVVGLVMVLLDLFLLLVGLGWLFWLGLALAVVGVVLLLMDRRGHPVGRRRSGL